MAQDKFGFVPPGIQQAMDKHMQNMPANLRQYQSGNQYIPTSAQKSMTDYMQKSMPAHLKQYITPYMQQKTTAGLNSLDPVRERPLQDRAPTPDLMRRDHSAYGEQFTVNIANDAQTARRNKISFTPQYEPQPAHASTAPQPATVPSADQTPYDFFMTPQKVKKPLFSFGGGQSKKHRLIILVAGLLVFLVLVWLAFSILGSSNRTGVADLITVAEQQQEIVRVATEATHAAPLQNTLNLAQTTALSVQSSQNQLLDALKKAHHKVGTKQLNSTKSSETDTSLTNAAESNTYDQVYKSTLNQQLTDYKQAIQTAMASSTNPTTKALLNNMLAQATVLQSKTQ